MMDAHFVDHLPSKEGFRRAYAIRPYPWDNPNDRPRAFVGASPPHPDSLFFS